MEAIKNCFGVSFDVALQNPFKATLHFLSRQLGVVPGMTLCCFEHSLSVVSWDASWQLGVVPRVDSYGKVYIRLSFSES